MNIPGIEDEQKIKKDMAKHAVALAMKSRWDEAVAVNRSILIDHPDDLEACNRLGKALSELGRNREAKDAFHQARVISPTNSIARKNLDRLTRLADETPRSGPRNNATPQVFIEESGKAAVTSLVNLAPSDVLVKLAPGHALQLEIGGSGIKAVEPSGECVGQVESKWVTRLVRLVKGGNRYEAAVTSVGEHEVTIIVREVYKHPSQASIPSFPLQGDARQRTYVQSTLLGQELSEEETGEGEPVAVKDWSDDDTEPGDDEAYTPVVHRIINTAEGTAREQGEEF